MKKRQESRRALLEEDAFRLLFRSEQLHALVSKAVEALPANLDKYWKKEIMSQIQSSFTHIICEEKPEMESQRFHSMIYYYIDRLNTYNWDHQKENASISAIEAITTGVVTTASQSWQEAFSYALSTASRLGLIDRNLQQQLAKHSSAIIIEISKQPMPCRDANAEEIQFARRVGNVNLTQQTSSPALKVILQMASKAVSRPLTSA